MFYDILVQKNTFIGIKNKELKKTKTWHVLIGLSPWFWSKIGYFSIFPFLGNLGQENVFYDIVERKNAFLAIKSQVLKKTNNWYVFKGVSRWFWSKIGHFSIFFFLRNLGQENVFDGNLERKNAFLCYKNKEFEKLKNWDFSKTRSWKRRKIDMFSQRG